MLLKGLDFWTTGKWLANTVSHIKQNPPNPGEPGGAVVRPLGDLQQQALPMLRGCPGESRHACQPPALALRSPRRG